MGMVMVMVMVMVDGLMLVFCDGGDGGDEGAFVSKPCRARQIILLGVLGESKFGKAGTYCVVFVMSVEIWVFQDMGCEDVGMEGEASSGTQKPAFLSQ